MLSNILRELYLNDIEVPLSLLKQYSLERVLENVSQEVYSFKQPPSTLKVAMLAGNLLMDVNPKLQKISALRDKMYIELLIKEIGNKLVHRLIGLSGKPSEVVSHIRYGLESACQTGNYRFNALLAILQFDELEKTYGKVAPPSDTIYYYEWNKQRGLIDILTQELKDHGIISSAKDFRKLFEPSIEPDLRVVIDKKQLPLLIAIIDELKESMTITPRGGKGHFHPISTRAVDLEGQTLFKSSPKNVKSIAKKNKQKWKETVEKAKSILNRAKVYSP
jgi:hypothetical protein